MAQTPSHARDTTVTMNNAYSELFLDSSSLEQFIQQNKVHDSVASRLREFYAGRNYEFAWFFREGIADYAIAYLQLQDDYIGYSGDSLLYNPLLNKQVDSLQQVKNAVNASDGQVLTLELQLTGQFFIYANRAYQGRNQFNTKDLGWFIPRKKIDHVALLDSLILNKGRNLSEYEPVNRQYNLLKNYLIKYYTIDKEGGWSQIKGDKKTYKEGDSSSLIAEVKKRLYLTEDLPANDTSSVFNAELVIAVKSFQHRYGMKEDGRINSNLLKELNRPVTDRIRQLLINMERIRWVPAQPSTDYLLVNIPEFRLHVYEKGQYRWSMNIVVGSTAHSTVIFTGTLKHVVFSPYWNVPPGILKNEILPGIKRNPNYLAQHNMEWNGQTVRQKPGPSNSLGLVKFLFPNSYNIYLHDTPSKSLFGEDRRAFSHGCIRLSEPAKLARYLLRNDPAWDSARIARAMNAGKERYVTIKETVPVYIGYFTAWVDQQGKLNFRDDVYGHDKKMAAHLFSASK